MSKNCISNVFLITSIFSFISYTAISEKRLNKTVMPLTDELRSLLSLLEERLPSFKTAGKHFGNLTGNC